ncbi:MULTISPECIES: fluoride efflux transporter CrcB [Donghicola]|jgi:CrcB protein|uniref:Fluoride-specific ion channel FluC n=1 Tax=Donghicola eburneus TaxID=393278 RepID=A0A1M4N2B0_9RHOB|nr:MULTISPECIES: fluoride efflux transporter CrcB [Donghicola]MCI5042561.1 fluoride efflux transporter CrcB [Donghicola eburneus]MCT4579296.1 fluoride efflux transporter CrcB [Donghicola sp.]SCM68953.1 putative membrane protein [Donghicola eburneus]SFQ39045.1 camphor resistance protein CrcB [Donghicola eburneus]
MILTVLQVALGGAIGASLRYLTNVGVMRLVGPGFPWGTVVANVVGSFAMGVLVVLLANTGYNKFAPVLMTGLLGGFTTFSAFSLDAVTLFERGAILPAASYILVTVVVSIIALTMGLLFARGMVS